MNIVILDDYQDSVRHLLCSDKLSLFNAKVYTNSVNGVERLSLRLRDADVVVLFYARTVLNESLLKKLPKLKLVVQIGSSIDHIDINACNKFSVAIAKGFDLPAVIAETTFALMLAGAKRLPYYIPKLKQGIWQQSCLKSAITPNNFGLPISLRNKILVVVGYNKVSELLSGFAKSMQMQVIIWDEPEQLIEASAEGWSVSTGLDDLVSKADFISLHVEYSAKTHHLINKNLFIKMKKTAILLNITHPALVATHDLVSALKQGALGMAVVDVFDNEPATKGNGLMQLENCLCAPHINNIELEYFEQQFSMAFDDILNYCNGKPSNIINPKVLINKITN